MFIRYNVCVCTLEEWTQYGHALTRMPLEIDRVEIADRKPSDVLAGWRRAKDEWEAFIRQDDPDEKKQATRGLLRMIKLRPIPVCATEEEAANYVSARLIKDAKYPPSPE